MGMGPIVCKNKTFNTIVASLGHFASQGGYYVLRHAIGRQFPGVADDAKKLAWRLYAMNLKAVARSYGPGGVRELMAEKYAYAAEEPHPSLAFFYQSIRHLRHQCSEQSVGASNLFKSLGEVLNAVAHEIAMEEAKKIDAPWE